MSGRGGAIPAGAAAPIGVLLAAGRGRRLGGLKQLRPWPPDAALRTARPLIRHAFDAVAGACRSVVIVLGHEPEAVRHAIGDAAGVFVTADPDAPMLASIHAGLRAAAAIDPAAAVLLHPGDVPSVAAATIATLLSAAAERPETVKLPEHAGRGGHPAWVPPPVRDRLLALPPDHPGGARAFWESRPDLVERIAVPDAGCSRDIDRPEDLSSPASPASPSEPAPWTR